MAELKQGETVPERADDTLWLRPRRLRRDGIVGGVAAGLSAWLGVPVLVLRILFVVAALLNGIGVFVYVALWLALRDADDHAAEPSRLRVLIAIVLGTIAGLILLARFSLPSARVLVPILLVGLGVALWRRSPPHHPPPRPSHQPDETPSSSSALADAAATPRVRRLGPQRDRSRPDREPPSPLARIAIAVALAALAVALLADRSDAFEFTLTRGVSLLLIVIGAALLVGARYGHARWLMLLAVPLAVALPIASTFGSLAVDPFAHIGSRHYFIDGPADLTASYTNGVGSVRLNLEALDDGTTSGPIEVRTAIGEIDVIVPPRVRVVVHSRVGWGAIAVDDVQPDATGKTALIQQRLVDEDGRDLEITTTMVGEPDAGSIAIDATTGLGSIHVTRSIDPSPRPLLPAPATQPTLAPTVPTTPTTPTVPSATGETR